MSRLLCTAAGLLAAGAAAAQPPTVGAPPAIGPAFVEPATPVDVPPAGPPAGDAGGLTATAELLLWRTRFADTGYALRDPLADLAPQGRVRDVQPAGRAGLRVGGRYRFAGGGWDVGLLYTHLDAAGRDSVTAPPGGLVYPLLARAGVVDRADRAAATVNLRYNVFDLQAGRTVAVDDHLSLRPVGGVRFADLHTDLRAASDGRLAEAATVAVGSTFRGAGPLAGLTTDWTLGERWGLFGAAQGGLLFGTFDGRVREHNGGGAQLLADVTDRTSGVLPTAAVSVGGSYRWGGVCLVAGYEVTHYFGAVARPDLADDFAEGRADRRRSDLSLDGVFLRLSYAY